MHHHVGIAANGRGEVGVVVKCQAIVSDVGGRVDGLGHRADGQDGQQLLLGLAGGLLEHAVDALVDVTGTACGLDLIAKVGGHLGQVAQLLGIGRLVHAVDKCLGLLAGRHLADVGGDGAVGQQHELLDELVGLERHMWHHSDGVALLVDVKLQFLAVERHRAALVEAACPELLCQVVEHQYLVLEVALAGLDDALRLVVVKAAVAADDRVADVVFLDLGIGGHLEDDRVGELVLVGTQRADVVAQPLGQHRDGAVHQIDRRGTLAGLAVDDGVGGDIVGHIGDVYANLPVAILELLYRQGVVEVLGIGRVDGERGHPAHVAAAGHLLIGDARLQSVGRALDVFGILVGQPKFGQDGMNLGIVLAGASQHVDHLADGAVGILWPLDDACHHLVARLPTLELVERDEDVGGQELAVHHQMGKVFLDLQCAGEHLLVALQNLDDLGLGFQAHACRADVHAHAVAMQGVHRVALGHHDGFAVGGTDVHTVLAVAAADECALGHHRASGGLVASHALLDDKAVDGQLFQNLDDDGALLGGLGTHGGTHLLVVECGTLLLVEEGDDAVLIFTQLLLERFQFILFCHS